MSTLFNYRSKKKQGSADVQRYRFCVDRFFRREQTQGIRNFVHTISDATKVQKLRGVNTGFEERPHS